MPFWVDLSKCTEHVIIVSLLFVPEFVDTVLQKVHSNLIWGHNNYVVSIYCFCFFLVILGIQYKCYVLVLNIIIFL